VAGPSDELSDSVNGFELSKFFKDIVMHSAHEMNIYLVSSAFIFSSEEKLTGFLCFFVV
jgi:hypothetical protein